MDFPVTIYEVIRVIDGVPLFLGDHIDRLLLSARLAGLYQLPGPVAISSEIKSYIRRENRPVGNIKLTFVFASADEPPLFDIGFIPHAYPTAEQYRDGVKIAALRGERPLPNAKIQHDRLRHEADQLLLNPEVYEVMLVDRNSKVTEGSRSNLFFIRDNMAFTAPADKVLGGITRNRLIALCRRNGIPVVEEEIPFERLSGYKAAFISGTSPKVLPVALADEVQYQTDLPLLRKIMALYDEAIENYISLHKD